MRETRNDVRLALVPVIDDLALAVALVALHLHLLHHPRSDRSQPNLRHNRTRDLMRRRHESLFTGGLVKEITGEAETESVWSVGGQ